MSVIYDFYDDPDASLIASYRGPLPAMWKTASIADPATLHDDQFALVLLTPKGKLRKYACMDAPHTSLSAYYFLNCGHRLTKKAHETAARNLYEACLTHGLRVHPHLESCVEKTAKSQIVERLKDKEKRDAAIRAQGQKAVTSPKEVPLHPPMGITAWGAKMPKTANVVSLPTDTGRVISLPNPRPTSEDGYGLVIEGRGYFPLDNVDRVKRAQAYFERHHETIPYEARRAFAQKIASALLAYATPPTIKIASYCGNVRDPAFFQSAIRSRLALLVPDHPAREAYTALVKEASAWGDEMVWRTLTKLDRENNLSDQWGRLIPHPVASLLKVASTDENDQVLFSGGGVRLTLQKLKDGLARPYARGLLKETFDDEVIDGLLKDPKDAFSALPDVHKEWIARFAYDAPTDKAIRC